MNDQRKRRPVVNFGLLELFLVLRRRRSSGDVAQAACQGHRWQPKVGRGFAAATS